MNPTPNQQIVNLCKWRKFTPDECMDLLQDHALVSDNCIGLGDVADVDAARVLPWLEKRMVKAR